MIERDANGNLPCPFCGGAVEPRGWLCEDEIGGDVSGPECDGCGATTITMDDWNRRVSDG
jgi:hypothetical protein